MGADRDGLVPSALQKEPPGRFKLTICMNCSLLNKSSEYCIVFLELEFELPIFERKFNFTFVQYVSLEWGIINCER